MGGTMPDLTAQPEEKKKRKGTALLAVMDENCSSCAGSPLCELHCPVENCINLLYEETPGGGLKPYRVWVDNDKCIGCQMCFSDDLTKIHRHKETGEIFREYAGRYYDSSKRPLEKEAVPKKFQLELIGTESEDRLDRKICPWDAIKMYEFDEGVEVSKYFYEPKAPDAVKGFYVTTVAEKQRLEEKQLELYENAG
jgi:ferredoxin